MLIESWSKWLKRILQGPRRSEPIRGKRRSLRFLPEIESLEDRITPGGDFAATVSGSKQVGGAGTSPSWTGAGLVTDVQGWLANSATNFGWIVVGNESAPGTAKEFASRENPTTTTRPTLLVNYTV